MEVVDARDLMKCKLEGRNLLSRILEPQLLLTLINPQTSAIVEFIKSQSGRNISDGCEFYILMLQSHMLSDFVMW